MRSHATAFAVALLISGFAGAADSPREPSVVLNGLPDRIYVIGETSANLAEMIEAEAKAAEEISRYIASGAVEGLQSKDKGQQSLLATAAYMGYPNVVAALLKSSLVREHINDADEMGLTPWIAANFSMRQSLWSCRPAVFEDPYKFVPMFVTQLYYIGNPVPPYRKVRELLEQAGARVDLAKAKDIWLNNCTGQSADAASRVRASTDLLKTVQELGAADFVVQMQKLQAKAAAANKK